MPMVLQDKELCRTLKMVALRLRAVLQYRVDKFPMITDANTINDLSKSLNFLPQHFNLYG